MNIDCFWVNIFCHDVLTLNCSTNYFRKLVKHCRPQESSDTHSIVGVARWFNCVFWSRQSTPTTAVPFKFSSASNYPKKTWHRSVLSWKKNGNEKFYDFQTRKSINPAVSCQLQHKNAVSLRELQWIRKHCMSRINFQKIFVTNRARVLWKSIPGPIASCHFCVTYLFAHLLARYVFMLAPCCD